MLRFSEEGHRYDWNGVTIPSVTQVIGESVPFGNFPSAERAANFGKVFHRTVELYEKGELSEYDPALEPWLNGWKKFRTDFPSFKILEDRDGKVIERKMYSKNYGFAGMMDFAFDCPKMILFLDIKTGGFSPTWDIQTSAYQQMYTETYKPKRRRYERWGLQVVAEGYKIYKGGNFQKDFNVFVSMLNVSNWKARHKL